MAKVSVIIPIYKVEKYLKRCVESIQNQTLEDIEIILVDDGSPDRCPEICDEFAASDLRIKVIHKKNGGLSSARNAGIVASSGKYLGYIDSDDYAEPDMFEKLYKCAEEHQVDFVMADYWRVSEEKRIKVNKDIRAGYYSKEDIIAEIFPQLIMQECVDYGPLLSVWHCLYNAKFVKENKLYFDEEIKWSEDCIYSAILGYMAKNFYYMKNEYVYNYIWNDGSISNSFNSSAWEIYCLMNKKIRDFFKDAEEFDFSRQFDLHILYFACSYLGQMIFTNYGFRKKYAVRKKVLNDYRLHLPLKNMKLPDVNTKLKLIFWLMKHRYAFCLTVVLNIKL